MDIGSNTRQSYILALIYTRKKHRLRGSNLNQGETRMCILGYLYSQREAGAYKEKILVHLPRTQSPDRLQDFLNMLLAREKIELLPPSTSRHEGEKIYRPL